jgi:putative membrane protein
MGIASEQIIDKAMRLLARSLAAHRLETIVAGSENIPANGPALIVAHHCHHLYDGLALFAALQRPFHIVVAVDWAQNRAIKILMESLNRLARWPMVLRADAPALAVSHLFSRGDRIKYQRAALRESVQLLAEGRLLVIFPEAYPNLDPTYTPKSSAKDFLPFDAGFVNIAKAVERRTGTSVPLIPAGLRYDRGKVWTARLNFGKALQRNCFVNRREFVRSVEEKVRMLSGLRAG